MAQFRVSGSSRRSLGWALALGSVAGLLPVTPALAQSPQDETIQLGSVRIEATPIDETASDPVNGYVAKRSATGTKTDTPLIETPQSISVVPREQIVAQDAANIGHALRYTADVVPEWRGLASATNDQIVVRGSAGYSVDFNWDGLHVPTFGTIAVPNPDPYFLERIEVLKGPSSVLYGQAAANGMVNLVSKRPTEERFGDLRLSLGNYGHREANFDMGGPLDHDGRLLFRLTALVVDNDSQVRFTHQKRWGIAPALTWKIDDATTLTVLGSYQEEPDLGYYDVVPVVGSVRPNPYGKVPRNFYAGEPSINDASRTYRAIGYQFEHRFGDAVTMTVTISTSGAATSSVTLVKARSISVAAAAFSALSRLVLATPMISKSSASARSAGTCATAAQLRPGCNPTMPTPNRFCAMDMILVRMLRTPAMFRRDYDAT